MLSFKQATDKSQTLLNILCLLQTSGGPDFQFSVVREQVADQISNKIDVVEFMLKHLAEYSGLMFRNIIISYYIQYTMLIDDAVHEFYVLCCTMLAKKLMLTKEKISCGINGNCLYIWCILLNYSINREIQYDTI